MKIILTSDTHYGVDHKTANKHRRFWTNVKKVIEKEDVKVLIWAGDLASSRQRQLKNSLEMARQYVSIPIVLVRGNHDLWDALDKKDKNAGQRSIAVLNRLHEKWFQKYNIHHLEKGSYVIEDIIIVGWDGWYSIANPTTNDEHFISRDVEGCPTHLYLSNRAWREFERVLDTDTNGYRVAIAVTHFALYVTDRKHADMIGNPKFYDMIKEKFNVFCCGHNHQFKDRIEDGCRVLNSGSDYNDPKFLLFEV